MEFWCVSNECNRGCCHFNFYRLKKKNVEFRMYDYRKRVESEAHHRESDVFTIDDEREIDFLKSIQWKIETLNLKVSFGLRGV